MTVLDGDFGPMGRAAYAEAARVILNRFDFSHPKEWRHHGLGVLQREITPTLRVHVWTPELFRFDDDLHRPIHDHRFDFVSFVAAGEIVDTAYRVEEDRTVNVLTPGSPPSPMTCMWRVRHAKVQTHKPGEDVELVCAVRATAIEQRVLKVGDVYGIARGKFHMTRCTVPVAVTLVSRSNFGTEPARILGRDTAWGGIVTERDETQISDVLKRARAAIFMSAALWFRGSD